eukprot:jgi/Mesen1/8930/ME000548S08433
MASSCLRAMWIYRYRVLKVKENLCDCYGTIAGQLLQFCDGADINLAYLSRCDFTCNYGTVCPFQTTVFALLGESHVVPDDATAVSAPAPAPASSSESETGDPAAGAAATPPPASSPSPSPSTSAALPGLSAAYPGPTPAGTAATSAGSTGGAAAPAPAIPASRKLLALSADIGISVADDGVAYAGECERCRLYSPALFFFSTGSLCAAPALLLRLLHKCEAKGEPDPSERNAAGSSPESSSASLVANACPLCLPLCPLPLLQPRTSQTLQRNIAATRQWPSSTLWAASMSQPRSATRSRRGSTSSISPRAASTAATWAVPGCQLSPSSASATRSRRRASTRPCR